MSTRNLCQLYLTPLTPGEELLTVGQAQKTSMPVSVFQGASLIVLIGVEMIGLLRQKSLAKYQQELH